MLNDAKLIIPRAESATLSRRSLLHRAARGVVAVPALLGLKASPAAALPATNTFIMAQLQYRGGHWDPRPLAIAPLMQEMRQRTSVETLRPPLVPPASRRRSGAHEALAVFSGDAAEMLTRSRFYRYVSVAEGTAGEADVLLSYEDGRPFLLERALGRGRVLLFTSTADRDWTDLPTRIAYVPLLHSLVGYAAQLSEAAQRPQVLLPGPTAVRIQGAQAGGSLTILAPDGKELLSRFADREGVIEAPVTEYTVPGIYRLSSNADADYLAANATRAESDFAKLQQPDLQARWQPLSVTLEEEATLGEQDDGALPGREIAGILLLSLVAVLMVENVCANRL